MIVIFSNCLSQEDLLTRLTSSRCSSLSLASVERASQRGSIGSQPTPSSAWDDGRRLDLDARGRLDETHDLHQRHAGVVGADDLAVVRIAAGASDRFDRRRLKAGSEWNLKPRS